MSKQTEAQRLAEVLRAFDRSKQYQPSGPGGQMVGSEQYRLIATGWTFAELHNAAAELLRQEALIAELAAAARLVIAWFDACCDPSKTDFYQRMQMCRDSEDALRAALAKVQQ